VLTVQVGSQISGIVKKLYADFNSVVKSNQVVAEIDTSTYQVNVQKAEAQVANSKANLALAEVQAHRASELFTNKLISASDQDTAHAQLQQAQAQVMSDEATLQNSKVQLSYCTIYAPVDGVVISRNVDVGQTVAASFNTPTVFLIANDLTKMQIDALVSEADIGGVATNQDVNFTVDAYPYRTFRGKVSQVRYGAVTNQSVISYDCVVGVSNPDLKLLPGMTANVSIVIAQRDEALKIPNAALRFRPPDVAVTNGGFQAMAQNRGSAAGDGGGARGGMRQNGPGGGGGPGEGGPGRSGLGGGRRGEGNSGGGQGGATRRPRSDRQITRTVYVLPAKANPEDPESRKPKPVQIKVGISDGMSTEVLEGLDEGTQIVIGVITTGDSMASRPGGPAANPFGGGGGFRRF
jgi:HlyD family secretion protein